MAVALQIPWVLRNLICPKEAEMLMSLISNYGQFPTVALMMLLGNKLSTSVSKFILFRETTPTWESLAYFCKELNHDKSWKRTMSDHGHVDCLLSLGYISTVMKQCSHPFLDFLDPTENRLNVTFVAGGTSTNLPENAASSTTHAFGGLKASLGVDTLATRSDLWPNSRTVLRALAEGGQMEALKLLWYSFMVPALEELRQKDELGDDKARAICSQWGLEVTKNGLLPLIPIFCPSLVLPRDPPEFPLLLAAMRKSDGGDPRCGCEPSRRKALDYYLGTLQVPIDTCDDCGTTLLAEACRNGCRDCVDYLTSDTSSHGQQALVNNPDHSGFTPLMHAAACGAADCIELRASMGADLEIQSTNYEGVKAVHCAAYGEHLDAMRKLHEIGADLRAKTAQGKSAAQIMKLLCYEEGYLVITGELLHSTPAEGRVVHATQYTETRLSKEVVL